MFTPTQPGLKWLATGFGVVSLWFAAPVTVMAEESSVSQVLRFFGTCYAKLLITFKKLAKMKRELTKILNLPGVIVQSKKEIEKTLVLEVEASSKTACCPVCQKVSHRLHQNHWHLIKDLPWGEKEVCLKVNRRQFKCNSCSKPFSEELHFVKKRQKYTKRSARFITEEVVNSNLLNIAKRYNLTEDEVSSMINQVSQEILPIPRKSLLRFLISVKI